MSREPDFSAKNRIFKNFLKCLKACLVGVFWVFQGIFSIVRHLGREPDFWAENRIFIWAENRIFEPRTGFSKIS